MNGKDYIAVTRLSAPDDETLAAPGESCERVAAESLPWLLEQGYITPAPAAAAESEDA